MEILIGQEDNAPESGYSLTFLFDVLLDKAHTDIS